MILTFKNRPEKDSFNTLEQKMVRALALHRELKKLLALEHAAAQTCDTRALARLTLRKENCTGRLEYLVRTLRDQLKRMAGQKLPKTCPRTLANRLRAIPGFTPGYEAVLLPLARDLEAENKAMIHSVRQNMALFREAMDRIRAVSSYTRQGG